MSNGCKLLRKNGTPDRIRTCDLRIRSPLLYPTELRAHTTLDRNYTRALSQASNRIQALKGMQSLSRGGCRDFAEAGIQWDELDRKLEASTIHFSVLALDRTMGSLVLCPTFSSLSFNLREP